MTRRTPGGASGPSGPSPSRAARAARGDTSTELRIPPLTLAMLDRMVRDGHGVAGRGRSGVVAKLLGERYSQLYGADEPWSDLPDADKSTGS